MNHLADYLSTTNATQRVAVIRRAKFPRTREASSYAQIRSPLKKFLASNPIDTTALDDLIERMDAKARRDPEARDEALRCRDAVTCFKAVYLDNRMARFKFFTVPKDISLRIDGVSVNIHLDGAITEERKGETLAGGIVFFLAGSEAARKNIETRRKAAANLVHWGLEGGNMEPVARLCMSMDIYGNALEKASVSNARFRANVSDSCREVCARWDDVEPPEGYDGPDWS